MGYVDKHLIEDEKVVYRTHIHWIALLGHILADLILMAGAIVLLVYVFRGRTPASPPINTEPLFWVAIALLAIGAIIVAWGAIRRRSTEMVVTTKHVFIKTGFIRRSTNEMILGRIESVRVEQSFWGRMLGYGTITLHGTGGTPDPFRRIAHPLEFRQQVQQQIDRLPMEGRRLTGT